MINATQLAKGSGIAGSDLEDFEVFDLSSFLLAGGEITLSTGEITSLSYFFGAAGRREHHHDQEAQKRAVAEIRKAKAENRTKSREREFQRHLSV